MEQPEKRDAIMQAAIQLVGERGFHGSPMAEIAEQAGVAAGTIYRFFDSKDTLIREIHAKLKGELLAAFSAGYPAAGTCRERFLHIGRTAVAFFLASPLKFRFLEQFHNSPYGVASRREKARGGKERTVVAALLEEARGQRIVKDLPLPVLLALTFGPLADLCRDHILGFITLDDRLVGRTLDACWDAIRLESGAPHSGKGRRA